MVAVFYLTSDRPPTSAVSWRGLLPMSSAGALAERNCSTSLARIELQQRYNKLKTHIGLNSMERTRMFLFWPVTKFKPLRQLTGHLAPCSTNEMIFTKTFRCDDPMRRRSTLEIPSGPVADLCLRRRTARSQVSGSMGLKFHGVLR